jgi:D-alanyl-D-alanine carboxypeptidase/D-alanyl-D-alanine-endopeptidase (penicillin-binding protein 4)
MSRRRPVTALLALATLLGAGGPAAAEATRTPVEAAIPPSSLRELGGTEMGVGQGTSPSPGAASLEALGSEAPMGPPSLADAEILAATADIDALEALADGDGSAPAPGGAQPTLDDWNDASPSQWVARIDARLAALHEAALAHAARRPDHAEASAALLRRLESLATGLHDRASLGIAVRDLDTGAAVFEHDAERGLNPASNHKLLTAVAALELLGEGYRWQTRVLRAGDALVLRGEGDPSLQVEDLERLAAEVASTIDLHEIRRVIVDDTVFSPRRFGPGYDADGRGESYLAPSGALSLQWNTVEIDVRGAAAGQPVRVDVSPACEHVRVHGTALGGGGALAVRSRADGEHTVVDVVGHLRAGVRVTERRRVADPGRFAGSTFAAMLARRGAPAGLPVELGPTPVDATPVATHVSAPLPQVLDSALAWSSNVSTEQILRTLGWRESGEPGDWDNGRRALERYWQAAGLSHHALEFENASGLSSHGRISAAALADLLAFAAREGSDAAALWAALPVAGRDGTLRGRLRRSGGRVRAKTGTLTGASALSGVVRARGGRRLGFSILVNGPVSTGRSRRLQDAVVMALVEHGAAR